jgi:hypothetical protein
MSEPRSLHVELRAGQSAHIGNGITVTLIEKTGKVAQLRITAPSDIPIQRPSNDVPMNGAAQARKGVSPSFKN